MGTLPFLPLFTLPPRCVNGTYPTHQLPPSSLSLAIQHFIFLLSSSSSSSSSSSVYNIHKRKQEKESTSWLNLLLPHPTTTTLTIPITTITTPVTWSSYILLIASLLIYLPLSSSPYCPSEHSYSPSSL